MRGDSQKRKMRTVRIHTSRIKRRKENTKRIDGFKSDDEESTIAQSGCGNVSKKEIGLSHDDVEVKVTEG